MPSPSKPITRLAVFASGAGSNAAKIVAHFQTVEDIEVALIVSNKSHAAVLDLAESQGLSKLIINRESFYRTSQILLELERFQIDFIVLAGFLWLVPSYLVDAYRGKILNIHPALLPKYGGKGMYGMHVHRAVKEARETESGITIHQVDEAFDEGAIVFQASCELDPTDETEDIRTKVLVLEHKHYPKVIEKYIRDL